MKKLKILLFILAPLLLFSTKAFSQFSSLSAPTIFISPSNPGYGQNVTATVSTNSKNIENLTVIWQINGVTKKEGVGEKSISFTTSIEGKPSEIKVTVIDQNGESSESTYTLSPSEVDLVVEPSSFVPPFYRGKSAFIPQGRVKITAVTNIISNGVRLSDSNLTFKWKKDGVIIANSSGRGKNIFQFNGTVPIKDISVSLEIFDSKNTLLTSKAISIRHHEPEILFYEDSPLYGIMLNNVISGYYYIGDQEEFMVTTYPLYFNVANAESQQIKYKWSVNGEKIDQEDYPNKILFKQIGGAGMTEVSLGIDGVDKIFQRAKNNFNVFYSAENY